MLWHTALLHSFLYLNDNLLCVCTPVCIAVHVFMDLLGSLDLVKEPAVSICTPFRLVFPLPLSGCGAFNRLLQFSELNPWVSENWEGFVQLSVIGNHGDNFLYALLLLWQDLRVLGHWIQPHKGQERLCLPVSMTLCCGKLTRCPVIVNHSVNHSSQSFRWVLSPVWVPRLPHPLFFWPFHIIRAIIFLPFPFLWDVF